MKKKMREIERKLSIEKSGSCSNTERYRSAMAMSKQPSINEFSNKDTEVMVSFRNIE